ncbi:class I SAM-dependent methyltransferase [Streptacidiphilus sp. P02-A3a]|uniref:class I SAM-dependent methyltransferase n=1 Tax=Streptacidiphilus sp. P02-A3a TaxID=2704468 RepID=UPI0015F9A717|nr:class I SAM-dependent methyltransferase [Streptacidiphilus sp. P02-A3a]QMU69789.1 methyltransferase domain-containing protein [Streptacidiphilus sp. P02-A3a]
MSTDAPARTQAAYHQRLYGALLDARTTPATPAPDRRTLKGLDQMGHFGDAGCALIARSLEPLAGRPVNLLELGSGFGGALRGVLTELAGTLDVQLAVGAELVLEHCRVAAALADPATTGTTAACMSVSALGFRDQAFDAVFATGSVSHFPDMARTLHEAYRVLRPGGLLTFVEEVSLHSAPVSAEFRSCHPPDVFFSSSPQERHGQLEAAGFVDIHVTALGPWAARLLQQRLLALRIYRDSADEVYGREQTGEIMRTLAAAQREIAAQAVHPVQVTARRPG